MTIDLNREPYFDDFDPEKGFHQILFRPGVAVQTRELNQFQTILQDQIDRFGRHIFRNGSLVLGGSFDVETDVRHVKVTGLDTIEQYEGLIGNDVVGDSTNLRAHIIDGEFDEENNQFVYIIRYRSSNENNDRVFTASENLTSEQTGVVVTTADEDPVGKASIFAINEGVVFVKGYFVAFGFQRIILDKFSSTPTVSIGFDVDPDIITSIEDQSLLDNAQGTFNFAAPGANRLAIDARLVKATVDQESEEFENFAKLAVIKEGQLEESLERTQFARIYDEIAKRTHDQSGDFYVTGLGVRTREHLDTGVNEGLVDSEGLSQQEIDQLANELSLDVEPGTAYVKGYEINNRVTKHVITDKAIDFERVDNQIVSARTGGFVRVEEIVGTPPLNEGTLVELYDTAETRVTESTRSTAAVTGTKIGEARLKSVLHASGVLGNPDGQLKLFLYDVRMDGVPFADVRAVYAPTTNFFSDVVLNTAGDAALVETIENNLIFDIGSEHTRQVRDSDDDPSVIFKFHQTVSKNINFDNGGTTTLTLTGTNEAFPFGVGFLSLTEKRGFIVSLNSDISVELPGTVSGDVDENTVTGTGTSFTNLSVGNRINIDGDIHTIEDIIDDTTMTVSPVLENTHVDEPFTKEFFAGDVVDLTQRGSNGNFRTVFVEDPTTAVINLQEVETPGSFPGLVSHHVNVNNVREIPKILRPNRYVTINCSQLSSLTAPIRLGFSDVLKIREVRRHDNPFVDATDGVDVTDSFTLINGQRDNQYDHGFIVPQIELDSSDFLLVKLDHFVPDFSFDDSLGFFSVNSYPIDDTQETDTTIFTFELPRYTTSEGSSFNLRDALDFRPVKENTAADATTVTAASTNPSDTNDFFESSSGLNTPVANSQINVDYSFFLARRDVVTVDQDGNFDVVRGVPAVSPVTPTPSESVMPIANVFITPFPSLSGAFARTLGIRQAGCQTDKVAYVRHTMRDIGSLKERIENLEIITSLNFLEKATNDLKVVDEDGLDRFKNGFFVDNFGSHALADTNNLDYKISVDKENREIRPHFEMDSFRYKFDEGSSSGVQVTGDLVTLPYTEETLIDQPRVSTTRNIEQSVFRYFGELDIEPRHDTWVDETTVDKTVDFGEDISDALEDSGINLTNTVWDSWRTISQGKTTTFRKRTRDRQAGNRLLWWDRTLQRTVSEQERFGTESKLSFEQQEEELGNFVTDVSVVPYIRPQTIKVFASSLLPNTQVFVFFDGEDMTDFVSPFEPDNTLELSPIFSDFDDDTPLQGEGTALRTDKFGVFYGELRLPAEGKRFRIGTKKIIITDSPTNADDAVTRAEEYFVAQGLEVQKQNTILSTQIPVLEQNQLRQTRTRVKDRTISKRATCLAYSFLVDVPDGEEGVFLSSVDVFIQSLDPELGVWFEILEMDSGGGITQNQVPFSEVWMLRDDERLVTTDDATTPTNVNFDSPVFLYANTQYAFVVHTIGINPNTRFWAGRIGEEDILTGEPITSRRLTGTVFTTNNGLNWDIVPDLDLKIRFNRAKFETGTAFRTAVLENKGYEFLNVENPSDTFTTIGEQIVSSDILTLSDLGSVSVGDTINGLSSNTSGEVVAITPDSRVITDGFNFEVGEEYGINNTTSAGTITDREVGRARLAKYNPETLRMQLNETNGLFREGVAVRGRTSDITAVVNEIDVFEYETQSFKPNHIKFNRTNIDFNGETIDKTSQFTYAPSQSLEPHENKLYTREKILHSRSNEVRFLNGQGSNRVSVNMRSQTDFVSPVVDLSRANAVYVHNTINDDTRGEDSLGFPNGTPVFDGNGEIEIKSGGNLINKYISQIVTLADDLDAEDIKVLVTSYIPPNTDIPVYIKARHREDSETIQEKEWIQLERLDGATSSVVDQNDFREIEYGFADENTDQNGVFSYSVGSINFTGFKQFQIKIGLAGTNDAIVPRVRDLRALALQV